MKKKMILAALAISTTALANSVIISGEATVNRGREQFREALLRKTRGEEGFSGSQQILEGISAFDQKDSRQKEGSVFLGTISNHKDYQDLYFGVALDYGRERKNYRHYGAVAEVGYLKNQNLAYFATSYENGKHKGRDGFREKSYQALAEVGHLFLVGEHASIYPSYAIYGNKLEGERSVFGQSLSLDANYRWQAFTFGLGASQQEEWRRRKDEGFRHMTEVRTKLSYAWKEDLTLSLGYRLVLQKGMHREEISLSAAHIF